VILADQQNLAALQHTIEGVAESKVFSAYRIDPKDIAAVLNETESPLVGFF